MLLVWSGLGFLVLPIVFGVSVVVGGVLQAALVAAGQGRLTFVAVSIGLLAAAAVNWWVGRRLNAKPGRLLVDPATGEQVVLKRLHKLFWIRMEYWSIPVAIAALIPLLAIGSVLGSSGRPI